MRRLLLLAGIVLGLVALPASGSDAHLVRGTLTALSAKSVSIQDGRGVSVACAVHRISPSTAGFAVGDSVLAMCAGGPHHLVLVKLRKLAPAGSADTKPVTFAGAVTALSDESVSLHDGDRDLTCKLTPSSPALTGVQVGDHIRVACAEGVLTAWERVTPVHVPPPPTTTTAPPEPAPPAPAPAAVTVGGAISALTDGAITVHNTEHGDVTCTLGASSPALGDFHVGDRVGMACVDGVLVKIVRLSNV